MKIKLEIDIKPDEVQDLFVPSDKQTEFAALLAQAYYRAVKDLATETAKTINPLKRKKHDTDV